MLRNPSMRPTGRPTIELVRREDVLPTFVIGSVRSGTSAMMLALRDGAQIRGFAEGVLANLLPPLLDAIKHHYANHHEKPSTMLGSVPEESLAAGIKNLFSQLFVETMGVGRWLDKTPGGATMIAACPSLLEVFPHATFIFCKRRGIENVLSRQNKFPGRAFESHCQGWSNTMQAWLETAPLLEGHVIAVDQAEMAAAPEETSAKVAQLLKLDQQQRDGMAMIFASRRPEQTRSAEGHQLSLDETGWSEQEKDIFRRVCGPMMDAFGYDLDVQKTAPKQPLYRFFVPVSDGSVQRENVSQRRSCRSLDAARFKIDPNPLGEPSAGIRHRMIDMTPFHRFAAKIRAAGKGAIATDGLVFEFSVLKGEGGEIAYRAEQAVKPGIVHDWSCDLPDLAGPHDVVLSVRPASRGKTTEPLSSLWIDARLV